MRLMRIMGLALFGALFAMVLAAAGFKVTSGDLCQAVVGENLRKLAIDANDGAASNSPRNTRWTRKATGTASAPTCGYGFNPARARW